MLFNKITQALALLSTVVLTGCFEESTDLGKTTGISQSTSTSTTTEDSTDSTVNNTPNITAIITSNTGLTAIASDVDGDVLTYSWSIEGNVIGTNNTLVMSEVDEGYIGTQVVMLTVFDGTATNELIIVTDFDKNNAVTVDNLAPVIGSIIVNDTHFIGVATDAEGDSLTYSWSINDNVIGTGNSFAFDSRDPNIIGYQQITLSVSDSINVSTIDILFDFSESINTPPVIVSVTEDQLYLIATAADAEGDDLTYTWSIDGNEIGSGNPLLKPSIYGLQEVTLTVFDGTDFSVKVFSSDFGLSPFRNFPPIIHSIDVSANHLTALVVDANNDELFYTWSADNITIGTGYSLVLADITESITGIQLVMLSVTDGEFIETAAIVVDFGQVTVPTINTAPVITLAINNGAYLLVNAIDAQGDNLTYFWSVDAVVFATGPQFLLSNAPVVLTGSRLVTITVSDGIQSTSTSFEVEFGSSNIPNGTSGQMLQTLGNPFSDVYMYNNSEFSKLIDYSIERISDDSLIDKMKVVKQQPTAVWINSIDDITAQNDETKLGLVEHLDAALLQQQDWKTLSNGVMAPMSIVLVLNNMPDRECSAFSSDGKLIQVGMDGVTYDSDTIGLGYAKYRDEYINPISQILSDAKYASLRIVTILEPNSFTNMIVDSNEGNNNNTLNPFAVDLASGGYCDKILNFNNSTVMPVVLGEGDTSNPHLGLYASVLRLAINKLHTAALVNNNIYTYLDIAGAKKLGWDALSDVTDEYPGYEDHNYADGIPDYLQREMKRTVRYFKQLVDGADGKIDGEGLNWIRGFASNVLGYTPTEEPLISNSMDYLDLKELSSFYRYNPSVDATTYIDKLNVYFTTADPTGYYGTQKFSDIGFIIDTARNGWGALGDARPKPGEGVKGTDPDKRVDTREHHKHWCNLNDAGIGERAKADPDLTRPYLDAYYWVSTPGLSDGHSFDELDYAIGSHAYNQLDDIEKDVVAQTEAAYKVTGDSMCINGESRNDVTVDVVPEMAPSKGKWFHYQLIMLIENAYPKLIE
ncbi:MAG: glycoside hydrolase family 6 protein [Saccharospirillaceae bacterium]|nr:glycoside hydrolase family 6 protein [Saccharospirillaceae bacterium]